MREFADGWFQAWSKEDLVTEIREAKIKPAFRANIWFVEGRDLNMLVDSGFGLLSLRENIRILLEKPIVAVATHSHCDHIGGHHEFAQTAIHASEADILRHPTNENTVAKGYVRQGMFIDAGDGDNFDPHSFVIRGVEPTRLLLDGDVIDLGDRAFEVIHVPGHSPGSIALLERATGILFSGDMVHAGPNGIGRYSLYHSDNDAWLRSVERLLSLPVKTVHAGHFESFGMGRYRQILEEYVERRLTPGFPMMLNSYE
jgi:glyoxylase-like metal-dependent hydrolase (beta-lactamase superfamily II)